MSNRHHGPGFRTRHSPGSLNKAPFKPHNLQTKALQCWTSSGAST
jgi:hypothetical protein